MILENSYKYIFRTTVTLLFFVICLSISAFFLPFFSITFVSSPLYAQDFSTTFMIENKPSSIAVNRETGFIYFGSMDANTVSVVDNSTNQVIANIEIVNISNGICINPVTNLIYVGDFNGNINVIDGQSNQLVATIESVLSLNSDSVISSEVPDSIAPELIAVNPITNLIYTGSPDTSLISVIDGLTNKVIDSFPLILNLSPSGQSASFPSRIAINHLTNMIYVSDKSSSAHVFIIDGESDKSISTINLEAEPTGISVNSETNRIYVTQKSINIVSVIDGLSNKVIANIGVKTDFSMDGYVAVNPTTNHIYISEPQTRRLMVIDGLTNEIISIELEEIVPGEIAVNPITNIIYVLDNLSTLVTVFGDTEVVFPIPTKALKAYFIASSTLNGVPLTVEFTDLSIGNITNWQWEFGDGETSFEQNPIHVQTITGNFLDTFFLSKSEHHRKQQRNQGFMVRLA